MQLAMIASKFYQLGVVLHVQRGKVVVVAAIHILDVAVVTQVDGGQQEPLFRAQNRCIGVQVREVYDAVSADYAESYRIDNRISR